MLRFDIDGNWEPEDFVNLFSAVESLYYKALSRPHRHHLYDLYYFELRGPYHSYDEQLDAWNQYLLAEARKTLIGHQRIYVRQVKYASPGKIDLLGVGEAFKSIEGIVDRLIVFFTERTLRREKDAQAKIDTKIKGIEFEKERESLRALQIENARELLTLRRDFPEEFENLALPLAVRDQEKISELVAEGKLIGVQRHDGEQPEDDEESS